jgi:large subunit ribosomal protein L18e
MTALKITKANQVLRSSIILLQRKGRSEKAAIWREAAKLLASGRATWPEVNVGNLSHLGEVSAVFVPGKVLGTGDLDKKLDVGAFSFSAAARSKIERAGGNVLSVEEFVRQYPQGSGVALVK